MQIFSQYLSEKNIDAGLYSVLTDIAFCVKEISDALKGGNEGYAESENVYGEKQVKLDILANDILVTRLNENSDVSFIGSEELERPYEANVEGGGYSVVFDPLDGSSLVDTNLAVGTIVGVYKGQGVTGRKTGDQVAAVIAVYGPRLTFLITLGEGVDEFIYSTSKDTFILHNGGLKIGDDQKIFAPGNINSAAIEGRYMDLIKFWLQDGYKLRYSGCMAADVNQIIKKGGGIFAYPGSADNPGGKLRLLYECAPAAFLVEQAGGAANNGKERILDLQAGSLHDRTPVFLGSKKEVAEVMKYFSD